jgi:cysteine desulfurase
MQGAEIYLDNSATTRVDEDVAEVAWKMMTQEYGNPSSLHYFGSQAYQKLSIARNQVAQVLGVPTECVYFTSGGTEGNNLVIQGVLGAASAGKKLVTTSIEHASVLEAAERAEAMGCRVERVKPGPGGIIRAEDIVAAVDAQTALVSVMSVNNKTGEVLPIRKIVELGRKKKPDVLIHTDFVQGFGKIPTKVWETGVDLLTLSGHKLHAPKGSGAVYIRKRVKLCPLQVGAARKEGFGLAQKISPWPVPRGSRPTSL